jgi:hypothetical protein
MGRLASTGDEGPRALAPLGGRVGRGGCNSAVRCRGWGRCAEAPPPLPPLPQASRRREAPALPALASPASAGTAPASQPPRAAVPPWRRGTGSRSRRARRPGSGRGRAVAARCAGKYHRARVGSATSVDWPDRAWISGVEPASFLWRGGPGWRGLVVFPRQSSYTTNRVSLVDTASSADSLRSSRNSKQAPVCIQSTRLSTRHVASISGGPRAARANPDRTSGSEVRRCGRELLRSFRRPVWQSCSCRDNLCAPARRPSRSQATSPDEI